MWQLLSDVFFLQKGHVGCKVCCRLKSGLAIQANSTSRQFAYESIWVRMVHKMAVVGKDLE